MRTLRANTPCDELDPMTGQFYCPYMDQSGYVNCEYWFGAGSDEDYDLASQDEEVYEAYDI